MVNQRAVPDSGSARNAQISLDPISFIFKQFLGNILSDNKGGAPPSFLWEILDSRLKVNVKIYYLVSVQEKMVFYCWLFRKQEITQLLHRSTKIGSTLRAHNTSSVSGPHIN